MLHFTGVSLHFTLFSKKSADIIHENRKESLQRNRGIKIEYRSFYPVIFFPEREDDFYRDRNSFDGDVIRKRQSEFPITNKADKEIHGIGLANVKKAAEKYHDAVDGSVDHKVFTLSVMMQNERRAE